MNARYPDIETYLQFINLVPRTGVYAGIIIIILSLAITVLAFYKRTIVVAYIFTLISIVMITYIFAGPRATSPLALDVIMYSGKTTMTLPYFLIFWMLWKIKKPER